jgi:ketosteroid isomerase-like protein
MSAPPCNTHKEIIANATQLTKYWKMHKLNVTSTVVSADGKSIVQTMKNHLKIMGKDVEDFDECEVVTFSDGGLIQDYKLYCDPAPIMKIFQEAGAGGS